MILIQNVSYYRNQKDILKDVSWRVEKGQHWSILGLNGSGKTTILDIINGYIFPQYGQVEVLGNFFGKSYIPNVRKEIGLVSSSLQHKIKDYETGLSVVLSGKFASIGLWEAVEKEDVQQALKFMQLLGCEHLQDEEYGVLSQGERQRVLIARALMANPKILILDEPCNGLDLIAREELLGVINTLSTKEDSPTLIYVTHHVEEILPCFTHTLLLKKGEVFAQGPSKELLTEEKLSKFYNRPVSVQVEQNRTWLALKAEEKKNSFGIL
ncbi:iron complex transport system ATP-binding protein [Ureibacillus xyleni]|uniref:Iron complex transport system ATP-binding protein n=1 Tax=Ureibacillus xyleni TaxID=614648 RepID=A0A285SGZ2_9BACL|nr:ABC transporter ATP-binding protein [Ureibacillus xyleni]SOC05221.1 iron complex transport system ATP-binding protein [Ureibacillus xyleni]